MDPLFLTFFAEVLKLNIVIKQKTEAMIIFMVVPYKNYKVIQQFEIRGVTRFTRFPIFKVSINLLGIHGNKAQLIISLSKMKQTFNLVAYSFQAYYGICLFEQHRNDLTIVLIVIVYYRVFTCVI